MAIATTGASTAPGGTPRVSVIIPVRDQPAFLAESLASVFRQPFRDVEVIVVDDGSTVDLAPALDPYRERVRIERQPATGVAAARNRGVALATAPLLAFHDADDLMEPARITALLPRLDADPSLAVAFGNGIEIDAHGRELGPVIPARQARRLARRGLHLAELVRRSVVYLQASLMRKALVTELGGFPPFPAGSDWWFFLRAAARGPFAYVDVPLFRYRQHATSITAARVRSAAAAVTVLRDVAEREPRLAEVLGPRRFARALARRLGRLAAQEERAGDAHAAREHLAEAVRLAPWVPKYRYRLRRLRAPA
jgi:glycosyltransferase involved in cell wall biosynthesis